MINPPFPLEKIKAYAEALTELQEAAGSEWVDGSLEAFESLLGAIKAQSIELVSSGHLKALEAVSRTRDTLCSIIELDMPKTVKNGIVLAMMAHYTFDEDLYRRVEYEEVSPKTMLALHLQLSQTDPASGEVTSRLSGLHISCFVEGFIETFVLRTGLDIEPVEFIKTIECLKVYIQYSTTLFSDIEAIAANLERLRPGLEQAMRLHNHELDPHGYKGRVANAVAMWAEFWVGLYETTQDQLVKEIATVAFMKPSGPMAWKSYERMGLSRSPKWHMNAQCKAHGLTLLGLCEHAIMTDDIDIITAERPDEQISSAIFKRYVNMLERVPVTSKLARNKAQFLIDKLITHCQHNADAHLIDVLVNSSIQPSFFSRHYQILGSRFAADLGM